MDGHQLDGVKLQLNPPFTVLGKVLMETAKGAPAPRMPSVALDPHVSRSRRDNGIVIGLASASPNARPDADGNLKLDNVYAGAYRIIAMNSPPGYYLDSVRVGEAEQSAPEVELSSGAVPITLVYKTNGGTVRGTAEKCASGGVVLVPQEPGSAAARDFYTPSHAIPTIATRLARFARETITCSRFPETVPTRGSAPDWMTPS